MQSEDYVPGVSGWKMHKGGRLEVAGVVRAVTNQPAAEAPKPFIILDGVTYISVAEVERASVGPALSTNWSVKTELLNGRQVITGLGVGIDQILVNADKFAINDRGADKILDEISQALSNTQLSQSICRKTDDLPEAIRDVIREELRPGGLLHRR